MKGTKDTLNVREDLRHLKLKKKLWLKEGEKNPPKAPFVISKEDKDSLLTTVKRLRVPSGFSSNFADSVNLVTKSFSFKSHDYHIIIQHLLPMWLMHAYPATKKHLFRAIKRIRIFFNMLCAKVVFKEHLKKAKLALTEAICVLETYFPPSFFVIMIHLMNHLANEVMSARPTRFRAMWTFEREMKRYKKWARNKRYIEGSIVGAYLLHEVSLYAMKHASLNGQGMHKRNHESFWMKMQTFWGIMSARKYAAIGRHTANHYKSIGIDDFVMWAQDEAAIISDNKLKSIVHGQKFMVDSYNKFHFNGYCFSTVTYDENKHSQNHGVSMKALDSCRILTTYYGVIKGIFNLEYENLTVVVFYYDWMDAEDRMAFKVDPVSMLPMVNLAKVMPFNHIDAEPFILASQATQVFYYNDSKFDGWSIVFPSPKRLSKAIDVIEVDRTMHYSVHEENERLCALLDPIE